MRISSFRSKWFRRALALGGMLLPNAIKIGFYRKVFGYQIGQNVRIGFSYINSDRMILGNEVKIGHLNRITGIPEVTIGTRSSVGHRNTFIGSVEFTKSEALAFRGNSPVLQIGEHCGISGEHHFDVNDLLQIGDFTTIAGVGSVFYTHFVDVVSGQQSCKPVRIGRYCMIGSSARFVPGSGVGDYTVVGMGSVVTKAQGRTHCLLGGNPAAVIRELPPEAAYFHRKTGWIGMFVHDQPPAPGK